MRKSPEEYLSAGAQRLLENPDRARDFLKTHLIAVREMTVNWRGKKYVIKAYSDIDWLPAELAVTMAKSQAGVEVWWESEEGKETLEAFQKVR